MPFHLSPSLRFCLVCFFFPPSTTDEQQPETKGDLINHSSCAEEGKKKTLTFELFSGHLQNLRRQCCRRPLCIEEGWWKGLVSSAGTTAQKFRMVSLVMGRFFFLLKKKTSIAAPTIEKIRWAQAASSQRHYEKRADWPNRSRGLQRWHFHTRSVGPINKQLCFDGWVVSSNWLATNQ